MKWPRKFKPKKIMKWIHKIPILLLYGTGCFAQKTIQIATKTIEKTISAEKLKRLNVVGEKATIEINTWDKKEISYTIELKAEHPDAKKATADLENVKLITEKIQEGFYFRNYFTSKDKAKPESDIRIKYVIFAPENLSINIENSFGKIEVEKINGNLRIDADFCKIKLKNIIGKQYYITRFGELNALQLDGVIDINADHTLVSLKNINGSGTIKGVSGEMSLNFGQKAGVFSIETSKTDIDIIQDQWNRFNYQIKAEYTQCQTPQGFNWEGIGKFQKGFYNTNTKAKLNFIVNFGSLKIK
jgi:hypothetical protein